MGGASPRGPPGSPDLGALEAGVEGGPTPHMGWAGPMSSGHPGWLHFWSLLPLWLFLHFHTLELRHEFQLKQRRECNTHFEGLLLMGCWGFEADHMVPRMLKKQNPKLALNCRPLAPVECGPGPAAVSPCTLCPLCCHNPDDNRSQCWGISAMGASLCC